MVETFLEVMSANNKKAVFDLGVANNDGVRLALKATNENNLKNMILFKIRLSIL